MPAPAELPFADAMIVDEAASADDDEGIIWEPRMVADLSKAGWIDVVLSNEEVVNRARQQLDKVQEQLNQLKQALTATEKNPTVP